MTAVNPSRIPRDALSASGGSRAEQIRQIFRTELGRDADQGAINHFVGSGLQGNDLLRTIRFVAGLDNTLFDDPAFSAFARQQRLSQTRIEQEAEERRAEIARQRSLSRLTLDRERSEANRRIDDDFEARGMFRSGGRIESRSRAAQELALRRQQAENQANEALAGTNRDAARRLGDLSQSRIQAEVDARNRLTNTSIGDAEREATARRLAGG